MLQIPPEKMVAQGPTFQYFDQIATRLPAVEVMRTFVAVRQDPGPVSESVTLERPPPKTLGPP